MNKKLKKIDKNEIIDIVTSPFLTSTRKFFGFDFTNKDIREIVAEKASIKGFSTFNLGVFLAKVFMYRDEVLDIPELFNTPTVFDGFDYTIQESFVKTHPMSDMMTKKMINSMIPPHTIPHIRHAYIPSKIINDSEYKNDKKLHTAVNILFRNIANSYVDRYKSEKYTATSPLDEFLKTLDDDTFSSFINNLCIYRTAASNVGIVSHYMWSRVYSILSKSAPGSRNRDILLFACTTFSTGLKDAAYYKYLRHSKDYVFFNKQHFSELCQYDQVKFTRGDKKLLDFLLDNDVISESEIHNHFSVSDNIDNFIKNSKITDDTIKKILENLPSTLSIKTLNTLSVSRPDVFACVAKKTLTDNIEKKVSRSITGDIRKLIDAGLMKVTVNVEIEDSDLMNLYLQLNK